jgi:replicative superfamily II helicase
MDLHYFLDLHGTLLTKDIPTSVKILQIKTDLILAQVNLKDAMFFPQMSLREGFYCSCPGKKPTLDSTMAHSKFMVKLCPHLTLMLQELIKVPTSNLAKMTAYMVPLIAGQEYILDYLKSNALISVEVGEYKLTTLGRLALNLYLYPDEVIWLKDLIENHVFLDEDFILDKALQYYAMQKAHPMAMLKNIMTLWMDEHTVDDILANYPQHGLGDIFMFRTDITRVLSLFQAIANYLGKEDLVLDFKRLESRITYGVKEDLCDLMDYYSPYLNRNRARILFNAGFTTITKVAQTEPIEIYKATKIPLEKIIEMVTLRGQPRPKNVELDNF